jgi:hypothetical protein
MELFGTTVAKIIEELGTRGATVLIWQFVLLGAAMTAAFFTHRAYIKSLDSPG